LDAVDHALAADPDDAPAYTTKAYVLLRRHRAHVDGAADQRALLDRLAAAAERAVSIDPRDASARDALGNAHVYRGPWGMYHGGTAGPWWPPGLDEFGKALAIRPNDPWPNNDAGVAHRWLGSSRDAVGEDPMPEYRAALASYARATAVDPQYVYAW